MATTIYLPKVGMTMEEGTLSKWLAPDGAAVTRGQPIFEMETEKVQMEIEAEAGGLLKQMAAEGAVLKPGDVVGLLLAEGETPPAAAAPASPAEPGASDPPALKAEPRPETGVSATPAAARGPVRASPIARRLADENGIEVGTLTGSGPDGRIVERDVQRAIEARTAPPPPAEAASSPAPRPDAPLAEVGAASVAYSGRRRTTGQRMFESLSSMAQLTLSSETAVDEAQSMLHGLNREWHKDGVVVTLTGLIVRACALALREQPRFNARLEGGQIVIGPEINVGVAVNLDQGLIVPVLRNADTASLKQVASLLHALVQKARADTLQLDDVSGGSFTVTSLEGSVVDAFTPIINPPQAAILGIGRVREVAAFEGASVVKRQVTTLSLTFDHRLNDGAPASAFLERVAELLSRPYILM